MGCEFSDKVRAAKREIVLEVYLKLKPEFKKKFVIQYNHPDSMLDQDTYKAYYHCKRVLKSRQNRG